MILEPLTGEVLQSAFNNFAKFTVKHLCWSLFLIKLQASRCATFSRNSGIMFSCKFSEIFKKTYFVEDARSDARVKWTKTIVLTKSIHRETPVMASFLVQLQTCGLTIFSKRDSITYVFLWKLASFTEHQFYRMLRDCFWFLVTFSVYYLPYQW